MKLKDFMKEVSLLFATEKLHDLDVFLQQNKVEAIANKKIILELNEQLGDPLISATFVKLEEGQMQAYMAFVCSINNAVKDNDKDYLFNLLKPISYDVRLTDYDVRDLIQVNPSLFNAFIKDVIDNKSMLNTNNQNLLKDFCFDSSISTIENLGIYYCNSTNDIEDKIQLLKVRSSLYIKSEKKSDEEKEEVVNQLFDVLKENKDESYNYFSQNLKEYVYLNETNIKALEGGVFKPFLVVKSLIDDSPSYLNYYLSKQVKDFKIEVPFVFYCKVIDRVDIDKFKINKNERVVGKRLEEILTHAPIFIRKIINDKELQGFLDSHEDKFTFVKKVHLLKSVLSELNKDEVEVIFNNSQIFSLGEKEKFVVEEYKLNYENNIIKALNENTNGAIKFGNEPLKEYMKARIDNISFIEKLNEIGKRVIIEKYIDYHDVKNENEFINNFLKDLPKENPSYFTNSLLEDGKLNSNQQKIVKYMINEKTNLGKLSVRGTVKFFPLLNDENKMQVMGSLFEINDGVDFIAEYKNKIKNDFSDFLLLNEKSTLQEMQKVFDALVIEKNNLSSQQVSFKVKKNKL